MTNQNIPTTLRTLNEYIELYRKAREIYTRIVVVNLNQYGEESVPLNITDLINLQSELTKIRGCVADDMIDWLTGNDASDDFIERRIKFIQLKAEEPMWGKQFGEYNDNDEWVSIIDREWWSKYYSSEEIATIKTVLDNIDANVSLINKLIIQSIERVTNQFLNLQPESPKEQEKTVVTLPPELDTPQAHIIWSKAKHNGWIDENYKFVGTRQQMCCAADVMGKSLKLKQRWKPFVELWKYQHFAQTRQKGELGYEHIDREDDIKKSFSG